MDTHRVEIRFWAGGGKGGGRRVRGGSLVVDGADLSNMATGFALDYGADRVPTLTVDLMVDEGEVDGDMRVVLPDEVGDLLVEWGWTPPGGRGVGAAGAPGAGA